MRTHQVLREQSRSLPLQVQGELAEDRAALHRCRADLARTERELGEARVQAAATAAAAAPASPPAAEAAAPQAGTGAMKAPDSAAEDNAAPAGEEVVNIMKPRCAAHRAGTSPAEQCSTGPSMCGKGRRRGHINATTASLDMPGKGRGRPSWVHRREGSLAQELVSAMVTPMVVEHRAATRAASVSPSPAQQLPASQVGMQDPAVFRLTKIEDRYALLHKQKPCVHATVTPRGSLVPL